MIVGQRLYLLNHVHDHFRHRSIHLIPARMVVLADGFRQFGVGNLWSQKLPPENNKNGITIPGICFFLFVRFESRSSRFQSRCVLSSNSMEVLLPEHPKVTEVLPL